MKCRQTAAYLYRIPRAFVLSIGGSRFFTENNFSILSKDWNSVSSNVLKNRKCFNKKVQAKISFCRISIRKAFHERRRPVNGAGSVFRSSRFSLSESREVPGFHFSTPEIGAGGGKIGNIRSRSMVEDQQIENFIPSAEGSP